MNRPLLGLQVHPRGEPEPITIKRNALWEACLFDLLKAYATQRQRGMPTDYFAVRAPRLVAAGRRDILARLIGDNMDWVPLDTYLAEYPRAPRAAPHRHGVDLCLQP